MNALAWRQLNQFYKSDRRRVSHFFKNQRIAKLLVLLISILALIGLAALIYFASYQYFSAVQEYEPFGRLTARYLVHAGMVISGWLVLLSATAGATNMLAKPSKEVQHTLIQPANRYALGIWLLFRPLLGTGTLLSIFWVPAIVSFSQTYGSLANELVIVLAVVISFTAAKLLQMFAGLLGLLLAPLVQGKETTSIITTIVIALASTVGLIRLILPQSLGALFRIDAELFMESFLKLPLNSEWLPTHQMVMFFETSNFSYLLPTFLLSLGLLLLGSILFIAALENKLRIILAKNMQQHFWQPSTKLWYSSPVMLKELLGIWRVKSERNSLLFFVGLFIAFFFFLQRALVVNPELTRQPTLLLQFSLGAALFINTAAFLRIVFPLLSREAESAWYMIREPAGAAHWQRSKTSIGFILTILMTMISTIGWFSMDLPLISKIQLSTLTVVGIVLLAGLISFAGLLVADWQRGQNPEEVSTSITGMLALAVSLLTIGGIVLSFGFVDAEKTLLAIPIALLGIIFALLFLLLKIFVTGAGKRYTFSGDRQ